MKLSDFNLGKDLLGREEVRALVNGFNANRSDYPRDKTVHALFDGRAGRSPNAPAVLHEDRTYTYGDLERESNRFARLLIDQYGPEANPAQMVTLQCEDLASLLDTVERTHAVFVGVAAAAREGLHAGRLVELRMTPSFRAAGRFAYVTLAGRTEAPAMALFRRFVLQHLRD